MEHFFSRMKQFLWSLTVPDSDTGGAETGLVSSSRDDDLIDHMYIERLQGFEDSSEDDPWVPVSKASDTENLEFGEIPNDVPGLVAEVRRLRDQVKRLEEGQQAMRRRAKKLGAAIFETVLEEA
jgi:hypothetical protein